MYSPTVYLSLVVLLHIPNVASAADVNAKVGERILIPCKINGTYVLPEWLKDASITIANQGDSLIHPDYTARFSYDSDQRTLIVDPVQLSDTGSYVCTHSGGDNSPQNTTVEITEPSETNNSEKVQIANRALFALAIVVVTAVIIMSVYILKEGGENKNENEKEKKKDKQNENTKEIKVILIVAAVLFITVSVFFMVMQTTAEDFEKLTEKEHNANIALLVVESVVFVLGVIAIIFLIWKICGPKQMKERSVPKRDNEDIL